MIILMTKIEMLTLVMMMVLVVVVLLMMTVTALSRTLAGLFAISGFSGGAPGRSCGGFQHVFRAVFAQFVGRIFGKT